MASTAWIVQGVERALGIELAPPQRWARHGEWTSYWIGPATWLLCCGKDIDGFEEQRDKVIAAGGALFDVGAAWVVLRASAEMLAKGCGVDLDAKVFPPGECRATLLARVAVLIAREETGFAVFVPRSYAESLRGWLTE